MNKLERTQDLPSLLEENSCFYLFHGKTFNLFKNRIGRNPKVYLSKSNSLEFLDIDEQSDWDMAENIMRFGYRFINDG